MTLNEIHKKLENIQRDITQNRFLYSEDKIEFNGELIIVVEELKLYKEALNIACTELTHRQMSRWCDCKCEKCRYYPDECVNHIDAQIERYLQKARERRA